MVCLNYWEKNNCILKQDTHRMRTQVWWSMSTRSDNEKYKLRETDITIIAKE